MTQEEIDAIPDEVCIEAHDLVFPADKDWAPHSKIEFVRESLGSTHLVARLLMQLRAKDAEIAALKGDDPDFSEGDSVIWVGPEGEFKIPCVVVGFDEGWVNVQCSDDSTAIVRRSSLRGIKHGRGEG